MEGYYKYINGEWICATNGIILPNTTEPTLDPVTMEAEGWVWMMEAPENTEVL